MEIVFLNDFLLIDLETKYFIYVSNIEYNITYFFLLAAYGIANIVSRFPNIPRKEMNKHQIPK